MQTEERAQGANLHHFLLGAFHLRAAGGEAVTPGPARTRTPRSQRTKMGLAYVSGCVHTEVCVRHHDRGWVPNPNARWRMVRDALAHAVWLRGDATSALAWRWRNVGDVSHFGQLGQPKRNNATHGLDSKHRDFLDIAPAPSGVGTPRSSRNPPKIGLAWALGEGILMRPMGLLSVPDTNF